MSKAALERFVKFRKELKNLHTFMDNDPKRLSTFIKDAVRLQRELVGLGVGGKKLENIAMAVTLLEGKYPEEVGEAKTELDADEPEPVESHTLQPETPDPAPADTHTDAPAVPAAAAWQGASPPAPAKSAPPPPLGATVDNQLEILRLQVTKLTKQMQQLRRNTSARRPAHLHAREKAAAGKKKAEAQPPSGEVLGHPKITWVFRHGKNPDDFVLEEELKKFRGMKEVKDTMKDLEKSILVNQIAHESFPEGVSMKDLFGKDVKRVFPPLKPPHMAFIGNPGTGKTTMARIAAKILVKNKLSSNKFAEVQRSDLVGNKVGETEKLVRALLNALAQNPVEVGDTRYGGVIFIDEAYTLTPPESGKDFGPHAVNAIMRVMNEGHVVDGGNKVILTVMVAGYPYDMGRFFGANAGLSRRITQHFNFKNMTPGEMAELAFILCNTKQLQPYKLEANLGATRTVSKGDKWPPVAGTPEADRRNAGIEWLTRAIEHMTTVLQRSNTNGGLVGMMFKGAITALHDRLPSTAAALTKLATNDKKAFITITKRDLLLGLCTNIPPGNWPNKTTEELEVTQSACKQKVKAPVGKVTIKDLPPQRTKNPQICDSIPPNCINGLVCKDGKCVESPVARRAASPRPSLQRASSAPVSASPN